ncbi:MAG: thermonuclease family protein [Myxococcota bacterium]
MNAIAVAFALFACVAPKEPSEPESEVDTGVSEVDDTAEPSAPDPIDLIDEADLPAGTSPCREPVLGLVTSVIDGDTIKVETGRGVENVRLIGIDSPEVDHSGPDDECFGEASKSLLNDLLYQQKVWLTFDAECDDYYDRTLAYIHTGTEEEDFVQRVILRGGWAFTLAVEPNISFRTLFQSEQNEAESEGAGLWGECR